METQDIYSVLTTGSSNQIRSLLATAPENSFKGIALNQKQCIRSKGWIYLGKDILLGNLLMVF